MSNLEKTIEKVKKLAESKSIVNYGTEEYKEFLHVILTALKEKAERDLKWGDVENG